MAARLVAQVLVPEPLPAIKEGNAVSSWEGWVGKGQLQSMEGQPLNDGLRFSPMWTGEQEGSPQVPSQGSLLPLVASRPSITAGPPKWEREPSLALLKGA